MKVKVIVVNKPNLYPTTCNNCGGDVIYMSNAKIYGKQYGSGYCYLCTDEECDSYVGTHTNRPREAFGILANRRMRKGKILCHELFDAKWKGQKKPTKKRQDMYRWLAQQLDITVANCHFGYFDLNTLHHAYRILLQIQGVPLQYDNKGHIINKVRKGSSE